MLILKPKIIHISCHGDEENNEFYLQFERFGKKDTGVTEKFRETQLIDLLANDISLEIKLVFVSACQSEKVAEIIKDKCKIPLVVSVRKGCFIDDEICILFSKSFYHNLLQGLSVIEAFDSAKRICR